MNFLEFVKSKKYNEAILFSRKNFLEYLDDSNDNKIKEKIKVFLTTLAYKDLSKFPH